jgi:SAM-dependent methyltransferase
MQDNEHMSADWDYFARENAYFSVVSWPEFEKRSLASERLFWESGRQDADRLLDRLGPMNYSALSLLEIGCGLGRLTHRFAEKFRQVTAYDVSNEMLRLAHEKWGHLSNVKFVLGNGITLGFNADESVDVVVSYICLQHLPKAHYVLGYLSETGRALKAGGVALLQFRTTKSAYGLFTWELKRLIRRAKPWLGPSTLDEKWCRRFDSWRGCNVLIADVHRVAERAGLQIEAVTGIGSQYTYFTLRKLSRSLNKV